MSKRIYSFGDGRAEGSAAMRDTLGGKGANLAEMSRMGLPVPPGFTIPTDVCGYFHTHGRTYPANLREEVAAALNDVERTAGRTFGDTKNPLLVSVRSGARASMPGMMDTVLNLGLNDETAETLAALSGDARFAYDSYRRFIQMYSDVVLGIPHEEFETVLEAHKTKRGLALDTDLAAGDWQEIITSYKVLVERHRGQPFPQDVWQQLWNAIGAVMDSWMSRRAVIYRQLMTIPESWGTAINIQSMVFGNLGEGCATGVLFTRNPSTGEPVLYGEYLENAQGEDVVAGIRTPRHISKSARIAAGSSETSLEEVQPAIYQDLLRTSSILENHFRDMQDVEFTVERGKLWVLQTRAGKRTGRAAVRIAVDLVSEGLISKNQAINRVDPGSLDQLLHQTIDPKSARSQIATGLAASPGAASGEIVFSAEEAEQARAAGRTSILVRVETSPEDISGMHAADGILTARGGTTSHAAVVARSMGKPCVCGAGGIRIDEHAGVLTAGDIVLRRGDKISIDGANGDVYEGEVPMIDPEVSPEFTTLMSWADHVRRLKIRANAETPHDARTALAFGAEGIGLARTEHMFFEPSRILAIREMILARDSQGRSTALAKLIDAQRADFIELFEIMTGLPVNIRLLDPPLHEFLPHGKKEIDEVAAAMGMSPVDLEARVQEFSENNPMLGFRGCRLAIAFPEIPRMQARAIFEAVADIEKRTGKSPLPEIMVPLIVGRREFDAIKKIIDATAAEVSSATGIALRYQVGTMIELPRAALKAGEIAETAEFFSFGTNDLTQTAFGISRDDAASFLGSYLEQGMFDVDPFISLDQGGVGELVTIAAERGRAVRKDLKLGICGEHGGDPASIGFCERAGLDYVSCSPYRVPIARLAAAQATLNNAA